MQPAIATPPQPLVVRAGLAVLGLLIAVVAAHAAVRFSGTAQHVVEMWVYNATLLVAVAICAARAVLVRAQRVVFAVLTVGLASWAGGDLYWAFVLNEHPEPPYPSPADAGWLMIYPALVVVVILLLRERRVRVGRLFLIDAVIAALGIGAVSTALVLGAVVDASAGYDTAATVTNLSYPVCDLAVLAVVLGAAALNGWRLDGALVRIAAGVAMFAVADSIYLLQEIDGGYVPGGWLDAIWVSASGLLALAAWAGDRPASDREPLGWRLLFTPAAFALLSLGTLVYAYFERLNAFAVVLAAASLAFVIVRMVVTFSQNLAMLAASRREALTDALTGLGNRRRLMDDLDDWLAAGDDAQRRALVLFDLNGFKHYNDSFGHPAGDALLARLGRRLAAFADERRGRAYRLGGDEFCVVVPAEVTGIDEVAEAAARVLDERGHGFSVSAAHGAVLLPVEASSADAALGAADRRMYAMKDDARLAPGREAGSALLQVVIERDADLGAHVHDVAALARATAERLGLAATEVERVVLAAELHDVGKSAIPEAILNKPTALDDEEWAIMRSHTEIGERILASAPTLAPVAPLVRASHERYDGGGYPDGLAGEEIPLGARIVFACDAFDAMVSDRPYRPGRSVEAAVAELRRCAGTQFDPRVAEALCTVIADRGLVPSLASA